MIIKIKRADGTFPIKELEFENIYYAGWLKNCIYGHSHIQIEGNLAYIHLYIHTMGGEVLKEMRKDFDVLKSRLRRKGIILLLGTHEVEGSEKWGRFIKLLGFGKPRLVNIPDTGLPAMLTTMEIE